MPIETGRVVGRKRIQIPNGNTVDCAVIQQITFRDPVDRGQETQYTVDNSGNAKRGVHVANVPGNSQPTDENASGPDITQLQVERIDLWRVRDPVDRGQETFFTLDSKTVQEPPDAPPYFTTHEKTHIVKYINTPDDGTWIESELIDKFKVRDPVDRGQETEYELQNPPDNQNIDGLTLGTDVDGIPTIAVDTSLPDLSDSGNGVDPPWRLDPFQNIVDVSGRIFFFAGIHPASITQYINPHNIDTHIPFDQPAPGRTVGSAASLSGINWSVAVSWFAEGAGGSRSGTEGPGTSPAVGTILQSVSINTWFNIGLLQTGSDLSGSPLVVNGKTIIGYIDALSYHIWLTGMDGLTDVSNFYAVEGLTWHEFYGGIPSGLSPTPPFAFSISGAPFTIPFPSALNPTTWQAVGLIDPNLDPKTPGFVYYGPVYCIRVA
jgi:hypothetical protein